MIVGVAIFGFIFLCKNKFKVQNLSLENEGFLHMFTFVFMLFMFKLNIKKPGKI